MHHPPRRPPIIKPLGAAGILVAICYFVLRLPSTAFESVVFTSENVEEPSHAPTPVAVPPSPQAQTTTAIPEKLWYKLGPNGLSDELRGYTDSCITKNPTFHPEFMTDTSGDEFVRDHFASSRPDIVDSFLAIHIPIIKADLLRYLILYEHGGVWNDLDVSCEAPISEWIPERYQAANISVLVGLEFDEDIWYRQFASWTIMAKAKSPHLWTVVEDCLEGLARTAQEHNVGIPQLTLDMLDDIVDVSGPRRLTRGIQRSLSRMLNQTIGNGEIAHVLEARLIGDVLVLPDYAFADSNNEGYGDKKSGKVLVTHHYAGSWKNSKGGEEPVINE